MSLPASYRIEMAAPSDPGITVWLQQMQQELAAYAQTSGRDFGPPATTVARPCAGFEPLLRKLAGQVDFDAGTRCKYRVRHGD